MTLDLKYRPQAFTEVLGQNESIKSLQNSLKNPETRPHTFLLVGPPGTGKTSIARIIANEIGCEDSSVVEMNAATQGAVDNIRDLVSTMQHRPMFGSNKIAIIDEAHALSGQAWSALLKPTEEPPAHAYWVLVTSEDKKIPKANKTRCVRYEMRPVKAEIIESYLSDLICPLEELKISPEIIRFIAYESNGSIRQALKYLEQSIEATTITEVRKIIQAVSASEEGSSFELAKLIVSGSTAWVKYKTIIENMSEQDMNNAKYTIMQYLNGCIMKAEDEKSAHRLLYLLDAVDQMPVIASGPERMSALLLMVGRLIIK